MKYLLDTCVLLFWLSEPERLSEESRRIIAYGDLSLSVVSLWEMTIKKRLGRLTVSCDICQVLRDQNINILDIQAKHALGIAQLELLHRDPFDHLLISVAKCEDMTILTTDRLIPKYPVSLILAA